VFVAPAVAAAPGATEVVDVPTKLWVSDIRSPTVAPVDPAMLAATAGFPKGGGLPLTDSAPAMTLDPTIANEPNCGSTIDVPMVPVWAWTRVEVKVC
jgi:hypothetical protein